MKKAMLAAVSAMTLVLAGHSSLAQTKIAPEAVQALKNSGIGKQAMHDLLSLDASQIDAGLIASQIGAAKGTGAVIADSIALLTMKLRANVSPEQAVKEVFADKNGKVLPYTALAANVTAQATKSGVSFQQAADSKKPVEQVMSGIDQIADRLDITPQEAQALKRTGNKGNPITGDGCDKLLAMGQRAQRVYTEARIEADHLLAVNPAMDIETVERTSLAAAKKEVSAHLENPNVLSQPMPSMIEVAAEASSVAGLRDAVCHMMQ